MHVLLVLTRHAKTNLVAINRYVLANSRMSRMIAAAIVKFIFYI